MRISDWIADVCSSDLNKDVIHVEADTGVAAGASRGQSANAELPTRAIAVVERHTRKKRTDVSEISDSQFLQPVSAEHRYGHRHIKCGLFTLTGGENDHFTRRPLDRKSTRLNSSHKC